MKNISSFRAVVLIVFALAALIGVVIFAVGGLVSTSDKIGTVELWGTLKEDTVKSWFRNASDSEEINTDLSEVIKYKRISSQEYDEKIVDAMATGEAPDLFFLPHEKILKFQDKIYPISYENYSQRHFKDNFVELGELYLGESGVYGLPVIVDPLIMYWNRSMFSKEGVATPPEFWNEVYNISERFSKRKEESNLTRSAVALGCYSNINHAKEILSGMIMQAGSSIVKKTSDGAYTSTLSKNAMDSNTIPAVAALRFFTQFSNPTKSIYSWNLSLDEARKEFLAEDLAIYFGFASELSEIRRSNPNLNFDVALFPKREETSALTFGKMQALAIPRTAGNIPGALKVASILSGNVSTKVFAKILNLPPVRRTALSKEPSQAYKSVFYTAALRANAWLDPNPEKTEQFFSNMIESVISGRSNIEEAIDTTNSQLKSLLAK